MIDSILSVVKLTTEKFTPPLTLLYNTVPFATYIILLFDGSTEIKSTFPTPKASTLCCTQLPLVNLYKLSYPENISPIEFEVNGVTQFPFCPAGASTEELNPLPPELLIYNPPPS